MEDIHIFFVQLKFIEIWRFGLHFWQKMILLEILNFKSVGPIGSKIFQNVPEPLAKL